MSLTAPLICLNDISFHYPGGKQIFEDLNLDFFNGERLGMLAPNGSGKTTLFHIIMGLLKPDAGAIEIFGKSMKSEKDFEGIRPQIGLLFQDADDQLFSPTVLEDVAFGPLNLGKTKEEAIEISLKTLRFLGLENFEDRITFKLSGGEKRLVSLATVLAMEPEILLLDEPTTGLDMKTRSTLMSILQNLDMSYILISHEFDFLEPTTEKIYTIDNRKIIVDEEFHIHQHEHAHRLGAHPHKHE
ncbi:MAG TPA: ABC transporter ATP-binding protein [Deltaproteobacteria bacterium]|nr:ABC transporter ATP-binding protein [Deltaproteobacteria bacterium]